MRVSRLPLLLLLLPEDLVTIPERSDCNLYKCKDTFHPSLETYQPSTLQQKP